jgi:glycosyltransferase involved in cell wall biosynthesis
VSTPLLILSDAVTSGTGLGRIARDLATRIHANLPEFRVGSLGYGGPYSSRLGFPQYSIEMHDWVVTNLPEVWEDFAAGERGILMTIWDASRLLWLSRPETCPDAPLREWLAKKPFDLWGYFPIDATGPHDRLTGVLKHTIEPYDRILAYSSWAEAILRRTLAGSPKLDGLTNLPHGIDTSVFYPRDRHAARHGFGERIHARTSKGKWFNIPDDVFLVGIVATNQVRKDWGLGIQTVAELAKERKVMVWGHTDVLERHWSLPALLNDYGLIDNHIITSLDYTDEQMAWCYSACDVTLGIGLGEGFGYPIFESLACGTPCLHGDAGGAPEHMPDWMIVRRWASRLEGPYNCERGVYFPPDFKNAIKQLEVCPDHVAFLPKHLDWQNLWPRWTEWLKAGLV